MRDWRKNHQEQQKIYMRKYYKENPWSGKIGSIELQIAMNNVRKRDHNTCQWRNCGLTHKETSIHVNHIFPRSEYPELELIEKYMICYCLDHHIKFHAHRGDNQVAKLLSSQKLEKTLFQPESLIE